MVFLRWIFFQFGYNHREVGEKRELQIRYPSTNPFGLCKRVQKFWKLVKFWMTTPQFFFSPFSLPVLWTVNTFFSTVASKQQTWNVKAKNRTNACCTSNAHIDSKINQYHCTWNGWKKKKKRKKTNQPTAVCEISEDFITYTPFEARTHAT